MTAGRLSSLSLLCCEASGGDPPEVVSNGQFCLDNIQIETDDRGNYTGNTRKLTPAGVTSPPGDRLTHWSDVIHEFDGRGDGVEVDDRTGEDLMLDQINALCVQHGVKTASDNVSEAWLDPTLVREGRVVERNFFKTMGVDDDVPRSEQQSTGGNIIGTNCLDVSKG